MACFNPIRAYQSLEKDKYGVYDIRWNHDHMDEIKPGIDEENNDSIWEYNGSKYKQIMLPCGKCEGCIEAFRREKAKLVDLEMRYTTDNWFITMTYDDEHLPMNKVINTGELIPTLQKAELKKFIDRVRISIKRQYNKQLRFLAAGEYGTQNQRPHYHLILMNCPLPDVQGIAATNNDIQYTSQWLHDKWGNGQCIIGAANPKTTAYTAGYCLKKLKTVQTPGREEEFCMISRNLGVQYFKDHKEELLENDHVVIGNTSQPIPKKFDKLFDGENEKNKEMRQAMARARQFDYRKKHGCLTNREARELQRKEMQKRMNEQIRDL